MAVQLIVAAPFGQYTRGQVIVDPVAVAAVLAGPYSDLVRAIIPTTGGSSGGNSISGVPSSVQVGVAIPGTYQAAYGGEFVCIRLAGADVLPRSALPGLSGSLPTLVAASAGVGTLAMYAAATGGAPLFETGAIGFTVAPPSGVVLPPNALLIGTDAYGVPTIITLGTGLSILNGVLTLTGSTTPPPTSSRARFAQDTATAGTSTTAAALFASMAEVARPTSDRTGTITTTADQTKYTWVAVLASAAGGGMHFFDGTGYGGFNGANSLSVYTGPDADPTTICQSYTDGSGRVWNLYRSSGHSVALTFTLS